MNIAFTESEWVVKFGPVMRTNHAGSKEQAEEGALRQVSDDVFLVMEKGREVVPFFVKGFTCPSGCGGPEVKEEIAVPKVVSYQLSDGKWFSVAVAVDDWVKRGIVVCIQMYTVCKHLYDRYDNCNTRLYGLKEGLLLN